MAGPRRSVRISRDVVLFCAGLAGVLHEIILYNGERPAVLIICASMMGLPLYFRRNGM